MRKCKTCGKEKPLEDFHKRGISNRTGLQKRSWRCKKCQNKKFQPPTGKLNLGKFKEGSIPWNRKEVDGRQGKKAKDWTKLVIQRDNNICQQCCSTKRPHAHHIKPWDKFVDLRFDISNGQTLCNSCHAIIHGREKCNLLKNGVSWIKGRKMSKEYCEKLSLAHKGQKAPKTAFKKGHIPWNKKAIK